MSTETTSNERVWPRRRILDRDQQLNFEQAIDAMTESENVEDWNWRRDAIARNYSDDTKSCERVEGGTISGVAYFLGWVDGTGLIVRTLGQDAPEAIPHTYGKKEIRFVPRHLRTD